MTKINKENFQEQLNETARFVSNMEYIELLDLLIKEGADLKANNNKALLTAIWFGKYSSVEKLIENGVDVTFNDNEAVIRLASITKSEIYKIVEFDEEYDYKRYITDKAFYQRLHDKLTNNHINILKLLIKNGANIKARNNLVLKECIENANIDLLNVLLENGIEPYEFESEDIVNSYFEFAKILIDLRIKAGVDNHTVLIKAIKTGNIQIVKYLIECGIDVRKNNNEAIINAIESVYLNDEFNIKYENTIDIINMIIEAGGNITAQNNIAFINLCKNAKYRPYSYTKYKNIINVLELMIEKEINVNLDNSKPLLYATINNSLQVAEILINAGAEITDQIIIKAIELKRIDILHIFINSGIKMSEICKIAIKEHANLMSILRLLWMNR